MQDQNPKVIDVDVVPQRIYVKFRCGVFFEDEKSMSMLDEFREDLCNEMAFAIAKVLQGKRNEDGSPKYDGFLCESSMKLSHEMVDWVEF